MRALGLEPGPVLHGDLRFEGGLTAGSAIAKLSPRPTAVMAVNDLTAVGVIKGLAEGRSVACRRICRSRDSTIRDWRNTAILRSRRWIFIGTCWGKMAADALHELSCSAEPEGTGVSDSGGTDCGGFFGSCRNG